MCHCAPEELYFLPESSEGLISTPLHNQTLWLPSADEEGYHLGMVLVLLVPEAIQSVFSCQWTTEKDLPNPTYQVIRPWLKFHLNIRKQFFTARMVEHWNREPVEPAFTEMFKRQLVMVWGNLL